MSSSSSADSTLNIRMPARMPASTSVAVLPTPENTMVCGFAPTRSTRRSSSPDRTLRCGLTMMPRMLPNESFTEATQIPRPASSDPAQQQRLVITPGVSSLKPRNCGINVVHDIRDGPPGVAVQHLLEAGEAELLVLLAGSFHKAVRVHDQQVARVEGGRSLLILGWPEQPERHALGAEGPGLAIAHADG